MSEVEILTPRGVRLSGTFVDPVDSTDAAVMFSHAVLCDRTSSPHFAGLAALYRSLGYATLIFDYAGHGLSDDDVITTELRAQDLRAASAWLEERGFTRQLLHAHSSGTIPALNLRAPAVKSMFFTSAVLGPIDYDWQAIFSDDQLRELERRGRLEISDDSEGPRSSFTITSQTLIDLSLNEPEKLTKGLTAPVALVYDSDDIKQGLVQGGTEVFHMLPNGSRLEVVDDARFSDPSHLDRLGQYARDWITTQMPIVRDGR